MRRYALRTTIEIDITSRTRFDNYEILGVPELWRYTKQGLEISLLQGGKYIKATSSPNFPNIPIVELINEYVQQCLIIARSPAMHNFRNWLTLILKVWKIK